jgi:two-component sensor histidine kinase
MAGSSGSGQLVEFVQQARLPLWVVDSEGRFLATSEAFRRICGEPKALEDLICPAERCRVFLSGLQDESEQGVRIEATATIASGAKVRLNVEGFSTFSNDGSAAAAGWVSRTEGKAPETEWLINQIAHALRNPIFAALVQTEAMILRCDKLPDIANAVEMLHKQLKRLETNLNEMLLLGRPAPINCSPLNVRRLLDSLAEQYRKGTRQAPAEVEVKVADENLQANWDHKAVTTILERLLDNAVQHTQPPHRVRLAAELCEEDNVLLTVSDDGGGIPEEILERAFLPFTPQHRGRPGLGLAIVAKYAAAVDPSPSFEVTW